MKTGFDIVGAILAVIGAVWALQGFGLIGGSFMTGQIAWLVIGVVCAIVGLALIGWNNLRSR